MFLIGVAPVSVQADVAGYVGIGVFLAVLLAIAIALHVVTAPGSSHDAIPKRPSDDRLGTAV